MKKNRNWRLDDNDFILKMVEGCIQGEKTRSTKRVSLISCFTRTTSIKYTRGPWDKQIGSTKKLMKVFPIISSIYSTPSSSTVPELLSPNYNPFDI